MFLDHHRLSVGSFLTCTQRAAAPLNYVLLCYVLLVNDAIWLRQDRLMPSRCWMPHPDPPCALLRERKLKFAKYYSVLAAAVCLSQMKIYVLSMLAAEVSKELVIEGCGTQ